MKLIKIFSTISLSFLTITAMAQQEASNFSDKTVSFGVKGGVNFATITGDDFESPDMRTSFHVGALVEVPVSDMFSVQFEGVYSSKGFKSEIDGGVLGGDGEVEYQLDYIDVPVLAKIYLTEGLSLEAGPQFSFLVNEEIDTDPADDPGDFETNEAKDFDMGILGGLTFQTDMGLFAYGRYTYGLTEIIEDSDAHNSVIQVGIGYKF